MAERQIAFIAEDARGSVVKGRFDGLDLEEAEERLRADGLTPLSLKPVETRGLRRELTLPGSNDLSLGESVLIARSLADMLASDIPLAECLALISARQKRPAMINYTRRIEQRVRAGQSLTDALKADMIRAPRLLVALTTAGEAMGDLPAQLERTASSFERTQKLRREMTAQLIYPAALVLLVILTLFFLSYFVLPQFETVFASADALPPAETQFVLAAGAFVRQWGILVFIAAMIFVAFGAYLMQQQRYAASRVLLSLPVLGPLLTKQEAGRYARTLGALTAGGHSLATALPIAAGSLYSPWLRDKAERAATQIRSGTSFTAAFEDNVPFPAEIYRLTAIGEASGRLGEMLLKGATLCEDDLQNSLKKLVTLAGPLLTVLMGLITAAVIAAVMSGVLSLNDAVYAP